MQAPLQMGVLAAQEMSCRHIVISADMQLRSALRWQVKEHNVQEAAGTCSD